MAETAKLKNARIEKFQGAPGESMLVDFAAYGDNTDDAEFFNLPGSIGRPQDGEIGIKVDASGINIVIGSHNYKIDFSGLEKGEHQIFSYDADGNILSSAKCNKNGEFVINDGTKETARKGDTVKLIMSPADVSTLAAALLTTGAFTPSGLPPVPSAGASFTGGEITTGTDKVLLP